MSAAARKLAEGFSTYPRDVAVSGGVAQELARELLAALDREAAGEPDVRLAACDEAFRKQFDRAEAAEKAQLESEDELATELAEARTLLQAFEKALREIADFEPHAEVVFDEFAYTRVWTTLRDHACEALAVSGVSGRPAKEQNDE